MADSLKTFFSPELVRRLADDVARAHASFDSRAFVKQATTGLDALELIDRSKHIARALAAHLPREYPKALAVLLRTLRPARTEDENLGEGMSPFFYLPHTQFVAEQGLEHFDLSMNAQAELTQRFTAEWSIRPYLARDPKRALGFLERWASHASPHVRRLVSEGTRLRLPWGARVAWLDANPKEIVALLERLKDDPSSMVRRSVANNLNDLGKVHPELLYATCAAWLPERRALVEHALRSAVKRGEPRALELLGFGAKPKVALESVRFEPKRVKIGERVRIAFSLRSTATKPQELLVDLAVHFVKANGKPSPKVFKVARVNVAPRGTAALEAAVSLKVHTTRKPQPGRHAVDVLVNGAAFPAGAFDVAGR